MKIKKIIAAVTAIMLIGGAYPSVSAQNSRTTAAFAAEASEASSVTEKGVRYNVYSDYAAAAEVNGELGCEIVIADEIGGKPVTAIEKGAFDAVKDKLKSVTLGNNIKTINERAFSEFSELTTVKLGDAAETIGNCAFAYCPKLESVTFGNNLTTIDKCAFFSCPSLVSLEFPDSLTVIDDFAFEMCTGISKVKFGKNLKHLGSCAFKDSSNISEVDLGENLEYIGYTVFSGENIRCLVIPEKVKKLDYSGCPLYFKFTLKNRDTAIVIKNPETAIISGNTNNDFTYKYSECIIVSTEGSTSQKDAEERELRYCTIEDYEKGNYERLATINDLIESYGMTFEKNETGLTLTGASDVGKDNSKIVIPNAVDGVPVTAIGKEAFKDTEIQYVYLGENITEIGESAFEGCKRLYMAVLNDGLKTIGDSAFYGCTYLNEIVAGDNIETIGEKAFFLCSDITDFKLTDNVKSVGRGAFGRTGIKEIVIPASVTELNGCPFDSINEGNTKTEEHDFSLNIRILNSECKLSYCDSADEWKACFIISDEGEPQKFAKLNSIRHCTSEEYENHDYIEYKTSYFGKSALRQYGMRFTKTEDGAELTDIIIPEDGVLIIPDEVETIPVTSISQSAIYSINKIAKKIKIGNNIKSIPSMFCVGSDSLRMVDIGDGVETIDIHAFSGCSGLVSVKFGKGVKEIGYEAFDICSRLQSIDIPNIVSLDECAFMDCYQLKSISLGNNLKTIGKMAFENAYIKYLELPDSLEYIGDCAFAWNESLEEIKCGSGLKTIGGSAFSKCFNLKKVTLNEGLTEIGGGAFSQCYYLENINFNKELTTIGEYAFDNCASLKKVTLNEGLTELGKYAFRGCYQLNEINIPTTLTKIEEDTFFGTSIRELVLPKNIKSVSEHAYLHYSNILVKGLLKDLKIEANDLYDGEVSVKILNPDCEIAEGAFSNLSFSYSFDVMYGYKGSTAEKYMADRNASDHFIAITDEPSEYLAGDTNCDGTVDLADAVLIMQALANPNRYGLNGTSDKRITEQGWENGDVDKNVTGLTVNDAQKIQSYLLGKIKNFD